MMTFNDLEISDALKRAIADLGITEPTPVQQQVIPPLLSGNDVLAEAPTGTGKTFAFALPIIEGVIAESRDVGSVVLCPTRELAVQILGEFKKLLKYSESIRVCAVFGGQNMDRQLANLRKKPQIIIATPGRLLDHIRRRTVKLHNVHSVVLDEADEMLDMGFKPDIDAILKAMPRQKQLALFSATMPKEITQLAEEYQTQPVRVRCNAQQKPQIEQVAIKCKEADKIPFITDILDIYGYKLSICFCNTRKRATELAEILSSFGYSAAALHGELRQSQRDKIMKSYRSGEIGILVATDVAARGIDVSDIDAIFNFDPPIDEEFYVHRIGRTARANKAGIAYTFYTKGQKHLIENFERLTKTTMTKMDNMTAARDFGSKKLTNILSQLDKPHANTKEFVQQRLDEFNRQNGTDYTPLDLLAVVIDGNGYMQMTETKDKKTKQKAKADDSVRFFLTIGEMDGANTADITAFVAKNAEIAKDDIVDVNILEKFCFVEVKSAVQNQMQRLVNMTFHGRKINVEQAGHKAKPTAGGKSRKSGNAKADKSATHKSNGSKATKPKTRDGKAAKSKSKRS